MIQKKKTFERIIDQPYGKDAYTCPFVDKDSNLWVFFSDAAICRWDTSINELSEVITSSDSLPLGWYYGTTPDDLFIICNSATISPNNSYFLFDKKSLNASKITFDTFPNFAPDVFHFENEKIVWTCNFNRPHYGLYKFEYNSNGNFKLLDRYAESSTIIASAKDNPDKNWLGRKDTLLEFSLSTGEQKIIGVGQSGSYIMRIIPDRNNNLWVITHKSILQYDLGRKSFFSPVNMSNVGIYGMVSNNGYSYQTTSGEIFLPGINGFYFFHPDSIQLDTLFPKMVLTDLKIAYQSLAPNEKGPIYKAMPYQSNISLQHHQNDLAIEYAGLLFNNPQGITYAYMLENYNEEWIDAGQERIAYFTNLSPGNYTFRVKAANADGVWNEEGIALNITIRPPWYWTWWSKTLYGVLLVLLLYLLYYRWRTRSQRKELAQKEKELDSERQVNERLRQVDTLKDQFLANTSHELRTPLQGIIGLSESMIEEIDNPNHQENLSMIISSGKRLSNLVNDILDFSKLKNYDIQLTPKPVNLYALVDIVLKNNGPLAKGKDLQLINAVPRDIEAVYADENRLQQILYNLVGNAIKFTESGHVKVSASIDDSRFTNDDLRFTDDDSGSIGNELGEEIVNHKSKIVNRKSKIVNLKSKIVITVEDTGIGIPESKREAIFQEFEQADGDISREFAGTGLGLSISKRLVELHGGQMWVESSAGEARLASEVGQGSTFFFTLPTSTEKATTLTPEKESAGRTQPAVAINQPTQAAVPTLNDDGLIRILVVDDEPINQQVFKNHLSSQNFQIVQALNGEEAIKAIQTNTPYDLVLLDVMMPRMSGYEVCQKIREKYLPSELPVIMVTAKDQLQDIVQGLSIGANDYLPKPFHKEELLARIKTQLDLHRIFGVAGRFVPNEFLRSLNRERITEVRLGDHAALDVAILFLDIRDYAALSERMTPEENFKFVNAFHGRMGPIVQQYGGFVNQYFGDAIMAIFPKGAADALKAAVDMQKKLTTYNSQRTGQGRRPIKMGIGLHSGSLIMGIIGDEKRMDATTIADTVNTASRIEGLTKHYGANILLSEESLAQCEAHLECTPKFGRTSASHCRFLGRVLVKGKKDPVGLYECFDGDAPGMAALKQQTLAEFEKGMQYFFDQNFPEASASFGKVLHANPEDQVARFFLNKSARYIHEGVPEGWTGVEKMSFK